jgi:hypothetical protein
VAFKDWLQHHINPETGRVLAKATIHSRLMALKAFTIWLAGRPGYRSRIGYSDADYFNPSVNDERIVKTVRARPVTAARTVFQDAREVRTKSAKTFTSTFFPVGSDIAAIIAEWIAELAAQGFEPDDPPDASTVSVRRNGPARREIEMRGPIYPHLPL